MPNYCASTQERIAPRRFVALFAFLAMATWLHRILVARKGLGCFRDMLAELRLTFSTSA
jgi:hypothetical protein